MRTREPDRLLVRTYFLWYPVAVAFPLLMVVMALAGFMFAAASEAPLFRDSLLLVVVLVLINSMVRSPWRTWELRRSTPSASCWYSAPSAPTGTNSSG